MKTKILLIALFFLTTMQTNILYAQNILSNGNFEIGGSGVGFFVNDYTLINPLNGASSPGKYSRTTNPNLMNSTFISGGDHTSGTGNMLVFDGAAAANKFFWTTGNTGGAITGFTAGTTYTFSYWIKSVSNNVTSDDTTRANIGAFFVNASSINPVNLNNLAPLPSQGWVQVSYSFVATANNVLIRLKTNNAGPIGNDFAVDDFSITQGGLPFLGSFVATNPTCPTSNNGSIIVNVAGGNLPYTSYILTGTSSQTNANGIFSNLGEGTYSFTVSDASGQTFSQSNIQLTAPNNLQLSTPITICQVDTTPLAVTGGTGNYSWTANPTDNSITNPNSASQNVSPNVTTVYTVTSGTPSNTTNLVVNGNFSQGNTGFTTEYNQISNPNPFGVQSSYDIVTNPNTWFTAFSSCGDHTTGTGNLMVVDGSTDPTGTIKVWCNATPISVLPNKNYTFSYYVASVATDNPAKMQVEINGIAIGAPINAPSATCLWTLHSFIWNSGTNTTASICIFDRESSGNGNDFALDDIALTETLTCVYQKSVVVTVTPKITPTFAPIAPICYGTTLATLPTTSSNGYTGNWAPAVTNLATTTYTFTPTPGQCAATSAVTIEVNPLPEFSISQGCNGTSYTLSAIQFNASNSSYAWFSPTNTQIGTAASVTVSIPGMYKVVVTQNGCSNEELVNVATPSCAIQKGISPNNDGSNDNFDLATYNVQNLKIFNRYGTMAYDKTSYQNEWYGQSNNGNELPDGTYYYVINFADLPTKTGWIYINRAK